MKQVVCLATSPWFPIPTRKQQVMRRLKQAQVLYFDPPVSYLAPLKDKAARPKLTAWRKPGVQVQDNVTVYSLPPVLPFFFRFRWINRWNQRRLGRFIEKKCRLHGFADPLLWVYSPTAVDCTARHSALIYDCVDRHSAYGGQMNPALVDEMELELAKKAQLVFATADSLCERLRTVNPRAAFIPNGADFARFSAAAEPQPVPADFPAGDGPVLGFVGALQGCIEYGYLAYAAKAHPEWRFVFIGRQLPGVDLSDLQALPNCHFLGLRPNEALPQYLAQFDVCLNLFDSSPLSREVSPLKFYEYLATGKPIVSTPQPEQVLQYRRDIHLADSREAFVAACQAAIADTAPERTRARIELGRACSWDSRVAQMEASMERYGIGS